MPYVDVNINQACFDCSSREYQELSLHGKSLYIFANHAVAIRAWHKDREKTKKTPNLITFDEHTDTRPPFSHGGIYPYNEERAVSLLKPLRSSLDDEKLVALLTSGGIERCVPNVNCLYIANDEHIVTGLYFDIIQNALICSPAAMCRVAEPPLCLPFSCVAMRDALLGKRDAQTRKTNTLKSLQERIIHFGDFYHDVSDMPDKLCNEAGLALDDPIGFWKYTKRNLDDECIRRLLKSGLDTSEPYILDIDLDYFGNLDALKKQVEEYREFGELVRHAQCITIATEPSYVGNASQTYNHLAGNISDPEDPEGATWSSWHILQLLLNIISYHLKQK